MTEPNLDEDGSKSSFQKTVVLRDWWLIKCPKEFEGKQFGVAGFEESVETRAMRVFTSSPITKALDVFTLLASDGIYITLRGFLNKERVLKNGFNPEISREFIFGFPPCWERVCNSCFEGDSFGTDVNTVPSTIEKACPPILSPCKYSNRNLKDNPAESREKSNVTETDIAEINDKGGSGTRDIKTARRRSLHLQIKRILESSKVRKTANDGDHGSEFLNTAKRGDVEGDGCEVINNEDSEWKLDESEVQNLSNDGDHGSEGFIKAKSSDVGKDKSEAIDNDVISPAVGSGIKHTGADNVDKVTSASATGESLTSEQQNGLLVTTASPHSLLKDLAKSSKPEKKGISKKSGKILRSDNNVVDPMNYSGTKVKSAENKRKIDACKLQSPTSNVAEHSKEGLNNAKSNDVEKDVCVAINNEVISPVKGFGKRLSGTDVERLTSKNATKESLMSVQRKGRVKVSKAFQDPLSKGKSKKSEKTLQSNSNVVEPMNHFRSEAEEAEENLSWEKIKRKIDFDVEVTPEKKVKQQKTNAASTDSLGQKRSRSGRVLVSSLEFWRNQIPVYDMDRNLIQVKDGSETNSAPSKGKGSDSRKRRNLKIK
ncbi:SANT associated [Arabidopsis thaliana x Arabidopsis arenosa]|nr:SANT associated [Arabidopsis thaliana x Arabidopsis arenosa]